MTNSMLESLMEQIRTLAREKGMAELNHSPSPFDSNNAAVWLNGSPDAPCSLTYPCPIADGYGEMMVCLQYAGSQAIWVSPNPGVVYSFIYMKETYL